MGLRDALIGAIDGQVELDGSVGFISHTRQVFGIIECRIGEGAITGGSPHRTGGVVTISKGIDRFIRTGINVITGQGNGHRMEEELQRIGNGFTCTITCSPGS